MTTLLNDNAFGTLGASLASTASAITFTSGHGARFATVASGNKLYCTIANSNNVLEEICITTHAAGADTADVVRAVGGTTAKAWNSGDRIEVRLSGTSITDLLNDPLHVTGTASSTIAGHLAVAKTLDLSGAAAGQIIFPAAQNASTATNVFDDYEEGPWTPTIEFGGTSAGMTFANQGGYYTKQANRVMLNGLVGFSAKGTATGAVTIVGFPFAVGTNALNHAAVTIYADNLSGVSGGVQGRSSPGHTQVSVINFTGTGVPVTLASTHCTDTTEFTINVTYKVT